MTIIVLELMTLRLSTMSGRPGLGSAPPPPPAAGPLLTSLLYPIEVVERMDVAPLHPTGHAWQPVDYLDVAGGVDSGALTPTIEYEALAAEIEALDVAAGIDAGTLTVLIEYETLTADPEGIDVAAAIDSGSNTTVINYIGQDVSDALDVSAGLVSGSLT